MASPSLEVLLAISKEVALLSPEVRREPALVDDLLDADFQEIGASGRLWTRAEMIAALADDIDDEQSTIEYSDMTGAVVGPDLVLLTYLTNHHARRARRSSLWRRADDVWRLLHHQGTPIQS